MKLWNNREDSLRFGLSFFLLLGAVLGSLFCNGMSLEMKAELHVAEQGLIKAASLTDADFLELFLRILPKRIWMLALGFLVVSASVSLWLLLAVVCWLGFSTAVTICTLTMDAGILGIWHYLLFQIPQCLFYVPVMYILLWWMPAKGKRLTVLAAAVLVGLVVLGAAAESFINPWVLGLI